MSKTRRWETQNSGRGIGMDLGKWTQSILCLTRMSTSMKPWQRKELTAGQTKSWSCAYQAASFLGHLLLGQVSEMGTGVCGRTQWQEWIISLGWEAWTSSHRVYLAMVI